MLREGLVELETITNSDDVALALGHPEWHDGDVVAFSSVLASVSALPLQLRAALAANTRALEADLCSKVCWASVGAILLRCLPAPLGRISIADRDAIHPRVPVVATRSAGFVGIASLLTFLGHGQRRPGLVSIANV